LDIVVPFPTRSRISFLRHLPRLWWTALLLLHAPILATVLLSMASEGVTFGRLSSALSLALAILFFVLKMRDVGFLRLQTRQQSFVALCLVIAIVHHDAAASALVQEGAPETAALVTTVLVAAASVRPRRGFIRDLLRDLGTLMRGRPIAPQTVTATPRRRRRPPQRRVRPVGVMRGPPA
jgi:hypothetical protein